ncbi:MAG: DJ-1/PfpI family protein [Actinobacteria bacterium]|nr:DJ-1/PfpI family protein [Actinomycetota bacterium]
MLKNINVLMIIAPSAFRDEEYQKPRKILESAGANITVASKTINTSVGVKGLRVTPDISIDKIKTSDYQAVIFVGGGGSREYFNDPKVHTIAKEADENGILIGAICIAPVILANAGLLKGKRATVFPSEIEPVKKRGAVYIGGSIQKDQNIITANGPESAEEFGKIILDNLQYANVS